MMKEKIRSKYTKARTWVFDSHETSMGGWKLAWVRVVRFFVLLQHMFTEDRLLQRASSLTYTTILSIFPLLAVITALGSVFTGGAENLENQIVNYIEERLMPPTSSPVEGWLGNGEAEQDAQRRENVQELTQSIRKMFASFRENAAGIGFLGFLGVLIAAMLLYSSVEKAFNEIWHVYEKASFLRTLTTFTTLIVCTPLLIGLSITVSVSVLQAVKPKKPEAVETRQSQIEPVEPGSGLQAPPRDVSEVPMLSAVDAQTSPRTMQADRSATVTVAVDRSMARRGLAIITGIAGALASPIINGIFMALAYMLIPRTKVSLHNALIGGLAAGFIWEAAKMGFGYYVFSSTVRNALFRSLGAVPIFLIWIYFTWVVFLAGNEIVYILQNYRTLRRERFARPVYTTLDSKLIFAVSLLIADAFERNRGGIPYGDIKSALGLKDGELQQALTLLRKLGMIVRTEEKNYTLTRPAHHIRVDEILALGCNVPRLFHSPDRDSHRLEDVLENLQESVEAWQKDKTLHDVLEELPKKTDES
jgi:uncharacterized BrkB/YihY/UPF0761 family membrane protein